MIYIEKNLYAYCKTASKVLVVLGNLLAYQDAIITYVQLMYIQIQTNDTMKHWSPQPSRQLIL